MTYRYLYSRQSMSVLLAKHVTTRLFEGRIVVITDEPKNMYAPFRRQWKQQILAKQRELSMTVNQGQKDMIRSQLTEMNRLTFTYDPHVRETSDVIFVEPADAHFYLDQCRTLYVAREQFLIDFNYYAQVLPVAACVFAFAKIKPQDT